MSDSDEWERHARAGSRGVRGLMLVLVVAAMCGWLVCGRVRADDSVDELVARALERSPRILAARGRVGQALAAWQETDGFLDPALYAAAGVSDWVRSIPGAGSGPGLTERAAVLRAGVELPVRPGLYVGAGLSEDYWFEPAGRDDGLYQTTFGVRARVPLMRDRGLRQWRLRQSEALADYRRALADLQAEMQALRHDVEQTYVGVQERLASLEVAREATARFGRLLDETRQLVDLQVVAEYQAAPAHMEWELRREEELQAGHLHAASLVRLAEMVGGGPVSVSGGAESLLAEAERAALPESMTPAEALPWRGDYAALLSEVERLEARIMRAGDERRPNVAIEAAATWRGESADSVFGSETLVSEDHVGGELAVVWRQALGGRAERGRLEAERARLDEVRARLVERELRIAADLDVARREFGAARERLAATGRAVEAAAQTLAAESERFRLGEGRSRNVIDAQRDLTALAQRRAVIAAQLLRSRSDFLYAAGYAAGEAAVESDGKGP